MPIVNEGVLQEMKHIANPSELKHIQELYEQTEPLMQEIAYALITGNDKDVDQLTSKALDSGFTANTVMDDGLIAGMAIVGIKFRDNIIWNKSPSIQFIFIFGDNDAHAKPLVRPHLSL